MALLLTPDELVELTDRERPKAQARVLQALGIPYQPRPDGTLIVYRIHFPYANQEKEHEVSPLFLP